MTKVVHNKVCKTKKEFMVVILHCESGKVKKMCNTCFDRTAPCVYIYVHIGDTMCISQLMGSNMAPFCIIVLHGKVVASACLVSPDDVVYPT